MKRFDKFCLVASTYAASVLGLMAQDKTIEAPENVAKAPENAEVTESGLASLVLQEGSGEEKPAPRDTVTVHYTGWQSSNGKMFDSSVQRGEPTSFPLNQVIPGWTEGLQLMVTGEKRRFWIPETLAYGPEVEGSGRPGGQLVFDVELISFEKAPAPAQAPEGALQTASGLSYVITDEGTGEVPKAENLVSFNFAFYEGEKVVQSSEQMGGPQTAPMEKLPPFFGEPFAAMKEGSKADVYIPGQMLGAPIELVKATVELVEVKDPIPAPATPEDVASVPEGAKKTDSGLAYKVLSEGEGSEKPAATSNVTVHYSGWETDGVLFDSSITRGETTSFQLNQVIKGWTEGLQLMSKGDKYRFWIPEDLAYGPKVENSGRPGGLLVFDVELVDFK